MENYERRGRMGLGRRRRKRRGRLVSTPQLATNSLKGGELDAQEGEERKEKEQRIIELAQININGFF